MNTEIQNSTEFTNTLRNFLDSAGRLTAFPAKRKMKLYALVYLTGVFEKDRVYSEKEVNALLEERHSFHDPATLRRELFNHILLDRDPYGREYRQPETLPTIEQLEQKYC